MKKTYSEQKMETPEFKEALSAYLKKANAFSWISEKFKTAAFKAGAAHVYDTSAGSTIFNHFLARVFLELVAQDTKWGAGRRKHPLEWNSILVEEVGEVSKEMNDNSFQPTLPESYENELVQVAAVAFRMFAQNRINTHGENHKKEY